MYRFITDIFLKSEVFAIRMAAINCISFMLNSDIEKSEVVQARELKKRIFGNIVRDHSVKYDGDEMEADVVNDDAEINDISSRLQLFTSIFCANFIMRKPIILEMSKLIFRYKLQNDVALKIFNKILTFLKCDANSLMDSNSIVNLLSQWYKRYKINL